MTQLEFGELVNKQLSRIELFPFFILETQYNSKNKTLEYTCYYYPDQKIEKIKNFQPDHFRAKGYTSTNALLTCLTEAVDNFLSGTKEDIIID